MSNKKGIRQTIRYRYLCKIIDNQLIQLNRKLTDLVRLNLFLQIQMREKLIHQTITNML